MPTGVLMYIFISSLDLVSLIGGVPRQMCTKIVEHLKEPKVCQSKSSLVSQILGS